MGDKNNTTQIGDCDTLVVGRHAILKSVYVTQGNAAYTVDIYDHGTTCMAACDGCLITSIDAAAVGVNMPYINRPAAKGLVAVTTGTGGFVTIVWE